VKRFPIEDAGGEITTVYVGDTIAIMPDVKYQYYVAARIGYHVGWINFKHVKLVSLQPRNRRLEETKPEPPVQRDERIAQYQEQIRSHIPQANIPSYNDYEEETQPAPPQAPRQAPPIPKKDVNRIISKLKSLGSFLGRR